MKRILLVMAFAICFMNCTGSKNNTGEDTNMDMDMEKITVINGAVPVYQFTIPEGDAFENYSKITAQFLVDAVNYRQQARVRAYGSYPHGYFSDLGDMVFLDFGGGTTDRNGPYLISNVIGTNRNLSVISGNAGANSWFTLEFPLYGMRHQNYNLVNYPDINTIGEVYFALGLGTGSASAPLTYYVKGVALLSSNGSKKIVSQGSGFDKPAFAGYPANVKEIHRVKVDAVDPVASADENDDQTAYYTIRKIYPWLYSIYDPDNVYCYLVVGEERALLFDTAYGIGSLPGVIGKITDKPVVAVLGHGHVDHANGAYQFDEAWLHEADFELCRMQTTEKVRRDILKGLSESGQILPEGFDTNAYIKAGAGNLKKLDTGHVFDLGGLHAEVVGMEGHTAGSVGLLIREHRVLLDSDAANSHVWMFLPESLSVGQYIAMLERTIQLDFDTFFVGHSDAPMTKADFQKIINVARNASVEKSDPYNSKPELKPFIYQEDGMAIVFSRAKL